MFKYAEPVSKFRDYIAFFWEAEINHEGGEPYIYNYIATTKPELLFRYCGDYRAISDKYSASIPEASFVGQSENYTNYVALSDRTAFFGVRFYPWVLSELFGIPATELTNDTLDIISLLGREGDLLNSDMLKSHNFADRIRVITAFLVTKIQDPSKRFIQMQRSFALIRSCEGKVTVDDIIRSSYISERQFERNFKILTGFSARTYLKILKFENALQCMKNSTNETGLLTSIALNNGYYDQAHFNRHFKEFTGKTPLNYLKFRP